MKLNYRKIGAGKPLFILHGLFGLSDNWSTVGKMLSENFEVYLIDLRNHGSSPHNEEWTYPAMANDIRELANNLFSNSTVHSFNLIGHSLGGKVAMQFASLYPQMLEKLIVVDIAPKDYPGNQFDFIEKLRTVNLAEMKTRKEAEMELKKIINDPATLQLLLKNIQRVPRLTPSANPSIEQGEEIFAWKFNLEVIAENEGKIEKTFSLKNKIDTPTLFIRGEKSNYILDSDIPKIKKIFPDSEVKTIEGAGHWVHADKPGEFIKEIRVFC